MSEEYRPEPNETPENTAPEPKERPTISFRLVQGKPVVTYTLIGLTAVIYLMQAVSEWRWGVDYPMAFGAKISPYITYRHEYWRLITPIFIHGSITHILFNMWALYIFGGIVAPRLGGKAFLALYLSTGLLGNLIWLAAAWHSPAALCGASGAVMAVTAAAAVMAPETPMLLLFIPFPIKLRTMAVVFFALELVMEFAGGQPGVANLVHIVGFIGGYLFIRFFLRREMLWDPLNTLSGRRGYRPRNNASGDASGWTYDGKELCIHMDYD